MSSSLLSGLSLVPSAEISRILKELDAITAESVHCSNEYYQNAANKVYNALVDLQAWEHKPAKRPIMPFKKND